MAYQEFDVTLKEEIFFNTLSFYVDTTDFIAYVHTSLEKLLERYSILQGNVKGIDIEKIDKDNQQLLFISIKYSTIDTFELETLKDEDKIRAVLNHMGFTDGDIKNITYKRKSKFNLSEFIWCVRLYDENYDFAPDESFSARDYEIHMHKKLREILGFDVEINFI